MALADYDQHLEYQLAKLEAWVPTSFGVGMGQTEANTWLIESRQQRPSEERRISIPFLKQSLKPKLKSKSTV